jgi:iron complex outermembrane receptor protein
MKCGSCWTGRPFRSAGALVAALTLGTALPLTGAGAQDTTQTGSVAGRVTDEQGAPLANVQVFVEGTQLGAMTRPDGGYTIVRVPTGTRSVRARLIGYRSEAANVTVTAGQRATQNFTLVRDPLQLQAVLVTGTTTPRTNLEASVAVTTLSQEEIERAAPRSTTEMLRYVPGFTRVESSGGEVNQNITMRGILGVEYVMFMEDGLPVFPTMHTFFMNADNLFRPDENIERVEVVRGGSSALFGSNTPGAIINFINKTGGPDLNGSLRVTAATQELARYDFNVNGPLGQDWRFNVGGFYRYDHGVRDPGFPGIRGGQLKASATRLLEHGYLRASLKYIDDRNQFILPLPFRDPDNPRYVPGFGDYGSMSTSEGNHILVPIPTGQLELPLDDGLRTQAYWLTADANFQIGDGWTIRNSAQVMQDNQGWNAIVPNDVMPDSVWIRSLGITADSTKLVFTNVFDASGQNRLPFNTPNHLVAPSGEWHVEKPISAFQNQLQVQKAIGPHNLSLGVYFANYTQTNRWYFTDILMDVRDRPHFLDLLAFRGPDTIFVTKNGFRNFLSLYTNGEGQTTVFSPVIGGSFQLTDRLRADAGFRYEWNSFVQTAENTSRIDLDGDTATRYDNEMFGNGSFRHFNETIDDWAGSIGLNYRLTNRTSVYALGSRGYKMPALDEFLNASTQQQVELFKPRRNWSIEAGVKHATPTFALTVNGFFMILKNITSQGLVTDPVTGNPIWTIQTNPENRSYGVEVEGVVTPVPGLSVSGNGTLLKADFPECPESTATQRPCPTGADVGTLLLGVPPFIGNLSASYTLPQGVNLVADWHLVTRRYSSFADSTGHRDRLPTYSYLNLGASYTLPQGGITFTAQLLNVYQSKGLEEGNPRLSLVGGRTSDLFLARPILPRRFQASIGYRF